MKKIYLVLVLALGFLSTVNAQTNVLSSGMSIQGIARDETNAALANIDQLDLTFNVYYLVGTTETSILTQTATVKTDNFGVFSYVLNISQDQYTLISTQSAYLKVTQGSVVFSNEKLQAVPYAIYAQNGVPTGTVVAYIGTEAPTGWMFCNGTPIPNTPYYANLKTMLGNATTTPGLNGMFLRAIGTAQNGRTGPKLMQGQQDSFESHNHGVGSLALSTDGNHSHNPGSNGYIYVLKKDGTGTPTATDNNDNGGNEPTISSASPITAGGSHTHTISGATNTSGDTETRPINWGVNWIIKI
jgi:hypothetical protein